jgi:hypothetical protein
MIALLQPDTYTWSRRRRPFHLLACRWAACIKPANRRSGHVPEACDDGVPRRPCLVCEPPVREDDAREGTSGG